MPSKIIKTSEIPKLLDKFVGETGSIKVNNRALYIQTDEKSGWQFVGSVENQAQADKAVNDYFRKRK
jgi:hypothetical protein